MRTNAVRDTEAETAGGCCCLCNRPVPLNPDELALLAAACQGVDGAPLTPDQWTAAKVLRRMGYLVKSTCAGRVMLSITDHGRQRLAQAHCECPA